MYERSYNFLKNAVVENMAPENRRSGLIKIMGEESIGFWVILDQILFFEDLIEEITTVLSTRSMSSFQTN
jgi:hypothetical protein